ncbi:hypothetical protein MY1884_000730 [Beauveria asiatica]
MAAPISQPKPPPSFDLMLTVDSLVQQSRTAVNAGEAHKMDPDLQCIG